MNEQLFNKIIPPVLIKTERLSIEDIAKTDKDAYARLYLDDHLNKWWGYDYREDLNGETADADYFYNFQNLLKEKKEEYSLAVKKDGVMIGELVLHNFDELGGIEMGFRFFKDCQGKGYAVESATALKAYVFNTLGATKLKSRCYKENVNSRKLIERLGLIMLKEDQTHYYFETKADKRSENMSKFFEEYELKIGEAEESPFMNKYDVYQDGTTPMYRDVDGKLWAMSGHSHMGHIGMFSGTCLDDMKEAWKINTNFCVGHAEHAYDGVRYPEGILPRGSIWPFGLYICPNTHRFFCWFHNETGWNGKGTAYDAHGFCDKPKLDSDFRHVGLMHSDDEGKNWFFDRWVLTGETVALTSKFNPGAGNVIGQKEGVIKLGSGDFCMYIEPDGDYIYLFYDIITMDMTKESWLDAWKSCDAYVARCRKRTDGTMGDFVKYYEGSFCEAGNLGKETVILKDAWHPRVVYSQTQDLYIMTSKPIVKAMHEEIPDVAAGGKVVQISTSKDLIHWTEPEIVYKDGKPWGNHYNAIVPNDDKSQPNVLTTDDFSILNCHNGTDVMRYRTKLIKK